VEFEKLINGPNDTIAKLSSLFGLSSTGAGAGGIEGNRGAGLTGIVLNPGDFSVVLRALRTLNEGRSLSMPKVLVASNEQATINSVLEQPFTTLNASDTVATTSFGGSSNAGTEVSVRPQIAEGDHLRLEYSVSLSAFVGEAADASVPPPKQQNNIDSIATIPDGYTIAVGGIELVTEGEAETGIPFISDIPILGEAFKNRSKSDSRSRFYVFIRSTILRDRDFEDLKYLSDLDVAEVGIDDNWPTPRPRLIR
jgi:general secretion pathway protein D